MTLDDIQSALEIAEDLPIEALRAGMAVAPELAPVVITVIEKAASGVTLTHGEWQLLFCGLHVLAAAREQSAYPAVMGLLGRSEQDMVDLFTDEYIITLARLLLGLFDGDAAPLIAALENRETDGGARWAVFNALARLTWEGRVPLAVTLDVIDRFERGGLAQDDDFAWEGWQNAIMYLGLEDRADKVRAAGLLDGFRRKERSTGRNGMRFWRQRWRIPEMRIASSVTISCRSPIRLLR